MRINRIYEPQPIEDNTEVQLNEKASHHISNVLRMKVGQMLVLFNGDGHDYIGKIERIEKKRVFFKMEESHKVNNESPLQIHLGQAISKGERMDLVIQKSVELGVTDITPVITERCNVKLDPERRQKRHDHWQRVATSAAEQCGRAIVPTIHDPVNLTDFLRKHDEGLKLVCHFRNAKQLSQLKERNTNITLVVGPEGGFSDKELSECQLFSYQPVTLGPRILRTETAPITAISVMQAMWGDLA